MRFNKQVTQLNYIFSSITPQEPSNFPIKKSIKLNMFIKLFCQPHKTFMRLMFDKKQVNFF